MCIVFIAPWELSPWMPVCLFQRRAVATDCNGPPHAYVRPNAGNFQHNMAELKMDLVGHKGYQTWIPSYFEIRVGPNMIALMVHLLSGLLVTKATSFLPSRFIQLYFPQNFSKTYKKWSVSITVNQNFTCDTDAFRFALIWPSLLTGRSISGLVLLEAVFENNITDKKRDQLPRKHLQWFWPYTRVRFRHAQKHKVHQLLPGPRCGESGAITRPSFLSLE